MILKGQDLAEGITEETVGEPGPGADQGVHRRDPPGDSVTEGWRHAHGEVLSLPDEINLAKHRHAGRRAVHGEIPAADDPRRDPGVGSHPGEDKTFAEDVAEIKLDKPRQGLQAEQGQQIANAWLDLIALVDAVRPSGLSAVEESGSWDNLIAMLILTFPEIRWVFGVAALPGGATPPGDLPCPVWRRLGRRARPAPRRTGTAAVSGVRHLRLWIGPRPLRPLWSRLPHRLLLQRAGRLSLV